MVSTIFFDKSCSIWILRHSTPISVLFPIDLIGWQFVYIFKWRHFVKILGRNPNFSCISIMNLPLSMRYPSKLLRLSFGVIKCLINPFGKYYTVMRIKRGSNLTTVLLLTMTVHHFVSSAIKYDVIKIVGYIIDLPNNFLREKG